MARPKGLKQSVPGLIRFFSYILPYIKSNKWLIIGAFLSLFAQTLLRLLEPWPMKFIIDKLVEPNSDSGNHLQLLSTLDNAGYFATLAGVLVLITMLRALMTYLTTICMALAGNHIITSLRERLFSHLQALSPVFHQQQKSGDLVIRTISDIGLIKEVAITAAVPLIGNTLIFVSIMFVMLWLNWQLALLSLSTIPLLWFITKKKSQQIRTVARKNRKREGVMAATAAESINSIKSVQALTLEDRFSTIFSNANNKSLKEGVKSKRLIAGLQRSVDILIALSTALVLWYGALQVLNGLLSTGELLVFVYYLRRLFRPIRDFTKYSARLAKASAAGERVLDILERERDVKERKDATTAPHFTGAIQFKEVTFSYLSDEERALTEINLEIAPGQKVAIVGPSGSGKSTIIAMLLRLHDPQQGAIYIDGCDIRQYTLISLRQQVSIVMQDTALFATTISNNITIGLHEISDSRVIEAAKIADIHNFISSLPMGYETEMGERGLTLSVGQRQRIAIARAAIRESSLLVLDEATTGLDPLTEQSVNQSLAKLSSQRTTLIITHRKEVAQQCDCILFVREGQIIEQGTHDELMHIRGDYFQQFSTSTSHIAAG
ncbi:MAG: ABC transporter ATP-binding protein [Aliivibrio sp.]|uniref:ABC transporter ATP-binding protein n=1 Tax=Aliivibrio sp. TaxID=1872443 RepID=UPI001A4DD49D|nr:ABC transporter ATP-binding protein [Aliivibrio sp.]